MTKPQSPSETPRPRRSVVSYVRRSPRMTTSQRTWLERYAPQWVIDVEHEDLATSVAEQPQLDLDAIFGRSGPVVVEIGSGHGQTLIAAAEAKPDTNFIGFEVFEASLAITLGQIAEHHRTNIRMVNADAVGGLRHLFTQHSVTELWIFFPDPWPKKRHHKRRLIDPEFVHLAGDTVVLGGTVRLATDWPSYAEAIPEAFATDPRFRLVDTTRFVSRPITKFERRGLEAGRVIHDFTYRTIAEG
ncbi:MAG: tRNA (guanosine(46)-N7)-methyltransferase TrmB [Propionibacteriaceae bacterium]|nr:tRNA (guanosine(46)-N7)-methyltransferase TrmB [Propionibacteriaceae bacterium]